jgi:hypothetical protein
LNHSFTKTSFCGIFCFMSIPYGEAPFSDPVSRNVDLVPVIGNQVLGEIFGDIGFLDDHLIPLDEEMAQKVSRNRERLTRIASGIDQSVTVAQELVRAHGVADQIDAAFLRPLLTGITERGEDESFTTEEVPKLIAELAERSRLKEIENASQISASTIISRDRTVTVFQGIDTSKFNLALPLVTDPKQVPVEIGPDAVTKILGAPLTDQDYELIAALLKDNTTGISNELVLEYEETVRSWAEHFVESGDSRDDLLENRKAASHALMRAMDLDPLTTDVAVHSIFTTVIREYPQLAHIETPQPFSN